ncbi:MarR family transcriptional regulator [Stenotrophomonas maltophilia]|uniref:MarR family winged helix-turn-helix transcriptional regulator n=1 Tax=Stenotrophomonas maltophilia TaxID=40324 RepID=UPI0013D974DF|nr:MarR family transcriptional regulator [Stenotrophomonas maltophilia]MBA0279817.1 MarR family transcriptional regulator [Stenotrophomonas maltophilia]MBA0344127.1 MarR family transcriptional regulator [Stenotrophomonas maltophilia]MBA0356256.1 MarR family transcriptional regulator [Stenotrophomonas maltophilia]MBA0518385.1 MarR family transcriptional regulator [Stenotrophomonas maltophilia]MDT3485022.1 MarR family transcriptional regulator [Stenotrophomonas maltophilia]
MLEAKHSALLDEAQRRGHAGLAQLRLCFQLLSLSSAIDRDCATRLAPHGLSEGRFIVLFLLHGAGGALPPHELAERAGVTRATVSGLIDGLQREGLLQRRSDAEDGRRLRIVLTAQGKRLAETLFNQHTQWIGGLFSGLDAEEQQQLSQLLHKVWQHTDAGRGA